MIPRLATRSIVAAMMSLLSFSHLAPADEPAPVLKMISEVGIDQKPGTRLPLDLEFVDEAGGAVRLGDFFGDKPVVLVLAYYRCPMLCTEVLNSLLKSSQAIPFVLDRDYQIVTVSIDPNETPQLAAQKKRRYVGMYRREGAERGWHFLTGSQTSITRLAEAVGFRYRYDTASDQFAHASGVILVTPQGIVSRYLPGIEYEPNTLRLALVESGQGKIGSVVDQALLLCYHYDPRTGRYGVVIHRVLQGLASATVLSLGGFLWVMVRRERRRSRLWRQGSAQET